MRHLKSILLALAISIILIGGIGVFLSKEYRIEKQILINAPADSIFIMVKDLSSWPGWTTWSKERDPSVKIVFEKKEGFVSKMKWDGEELEKGELILIKAVENSELNFELILEESFKSKGKILLEKMGNSKTTVKWIMEGNVGNNIPQRYFLLLAENFIAPDIESSLNRLKKLKEKE